MRSHSEVDLGENKKGFGVLREIKPLERQFKAGMVLRKSVRMDRGDGNVFTITQYVQSSEGRSL